VFHKNFKFTLYRISQKCHTHGDISLKAVCQLGISVWLHGQGEKADKQKRKIL